MARGVAASRPASTGRVTPETHRASSDARNRAALATSHAVPSMPRGAGAAAQGQHFLGGVAGHHGTAHVAGGDAVHPHVVPAVVDRHGVAQANDAALGRGVGIGWAARCRPAGPRWTTS